MPKCWECLTENVTVKVIDLHGFEHWFCAEDWAAWQTFHEKFDAMIADAVEALNDGSA